MESDFNDKDMNDIDYFTTIGQKNEVNKAVDNTEKRINNSKESASRRKSMTKEKIRAREKLIKKRMKITSVAGVLAGVLATSGVVGLYNLIATNLKPGEALKNLKGKAQEVLVDEGLATKDEKGKIEVKDNSIEDYECLDLTHASNVEQFVYKEVLGSEFNDAIQTASYDDGAYNYTGTTQWYLINGYINKDTKEASPDEAYAAVKDDLAKAFDNDCEGVIRTAEELVSSRAQGRGY